MSADADEPDRRTRLYEFPGGVLEVWDRADGTDDDGPGFYLELFEPGSDIQSDEGGRTPLEAS